MKDFFYVQKFLEIQKIAGWEPVRTEAQRSSPTIGR